MNVGIIGGTGPAGKALASRLAVNGTEVRVGSRSKERANEVVAELVASWSGKDLSKLSGAANEDAATADIVVLATPWDGALQTIGDLVEPLKGRVLVSMVNALVRVRREFQPIIPARGSIAATLQWALPDTTVTAAFQHIPAGDLGALDKNIGADVLVCADDKAGADATIALVEAIPGFRAFHAGSLASANAIEALTPALLNVNIRYKSHFAIRLTELGE